MLRRRRKNARTVAKLARALATLDREAYTTRPAPRRAATLSLSR